MFEYKGYYDKNRFWHLPDEWKCLGGEKIKKTASFYGDKLNFYIDSSDGVNEDLGMYEFTWRVKEIIKECAGKPFIMFKTSYSHVHSKRLKKLAQAHNGDVLPYFLWSYYNDFKYLLDNRDKFLEIKRNTIKEYDIGFISSLEPYQYPDGDGGELTINTRQDLFDKLSNSRFNFFHEERMDFDDYIKESFKCKLVLNVPGIGEYTGRMLESWALGQALLCRKNTYDNAISYKPYVLEIDFNNNDWERGIEMAIDSYEGWEQASEEYWNFVYADRSKMFDYIKENI